MPKKSIKWVCGAVIGGCFLAANYAAQHGWPLWSITLVGVVFLATVLVYVITAQESREKDDHE